MTLLDILLQERHHDELRGLIDRSDGAEAAAYMLWGQVRIARDPWDQRARLRLTSHAVLPVPAADQVSASATHVTWATESYVRLLRQARDEGLVAGIVHTHPQGAADFSEQDNANERELLQLACNRNGAGTALISVLWANSSTLRARLWDHPKVPIDAQSVAVIGRQFQFHRRVPAPSGVESLFARQTLALGAAVTAQLRQMRIAVVGCGGTGSATAMLLARLGVGQLVLIDEDIVDVTNLNRLHGSRRSDADAMRPKVDVIAREVAAMAVGTRVVPVRGWVGDAALRDVLKSCDLIFGCTDDHEGRLLLNRLAYFYLIPVIDMGLAIEHGPAGHLRDLTGRITWLGPGAPCLICRDIVDPITARDESLRRQHPEEYERRKREGYIRGGGEPAPSVVTFTTATACMALDELLHALTGFRGTDHSVTQRVRRFDLFLDRRPGATQDPHCPICVDTMYWGRGDVDPFLDRTG